MFRSPFTRRVSGNLLFLLALALSIAMVVTAPSRGSAQDTAAPIFTITGVDASQFPVISVTAYGANLEKPLADLPAVLTEDNAERPILSSEPVDVGIQVGVLFDLSANVLPRYNELADAVERFRVAKLSADTDWLAAYSADPENAELVVISDWVQDHQGMANEVRLKAPATAAAQTPLFGLISSALDRFSSSATPPNLRRTLLVFSDGTDVVSAQQLETIMRKAARLGVTIDTVMIGNAQNAANRRNLEQIALETGGSYWDFGDIGKIANIETMWRDLGAERQQQKYTYRMTKPQPSALGLSVGLSDGRRLTAESDFPAVDAHTPEVEVVNPAAGAEILRTASAPDTPLGEIAPATLPVELKITWPDNHPRNVQRVEYEIGGHAEVQTAEPFGRIDFPIADLDAGSYILRATVIDELGLEGKSAPVSFPIRIVIPTPVPPTETPIPPAETPVPPVTQDPPTPGDVSGTVVPDGTVTTTVILPTPPAAPQITWSMTLPGIGRLAYGQSSDGSGSAVYVGTGRVIPVNPLTIGLALLPFLLVIAVVVMLPLRKKPADDVFAAATEVAYDSTAFDSKPTMVEQTAYELTEDATEPQVMVNFVSPASLICVDGGDHLPPKLDIEGGREVRIGRKQAYCDVIIDDQRVSRLHASIVEKDDGKFYIKDEGSSGGTYVNRRKLRINDLVELQHNAVINFNTVAYRFELNDQEGRAAQAAQAGKP